MIKHTELRCGNLFQLTKHGEIESVYQITFSRRDGHLINGGIPIDAIEGLPLSEEWLLRAGLIKEGVRFYFKTKDGLPNYDKYLWYSNDNQGYWFEIYDATPHAKPIRYVHTLQNLYFHLTEEELIFKDL